MAKKRPATEEKLEQAAQRALTGENLVNEEHGSAAKPLSFHPLKFETAVSALLKVKPPAKAAKAKE
jgi:hypothetical protein